ncbi:HutD/Ves family protein [Streptacidiphilus sp. PAMC 29251]
MILRAADRSAVPWRNGGGVTREIACRPALDPAGSPAAGFDWRISLAEIDTDGPFSAFPGTDRVITAVDGAGFELTVDGSVHPLPGRHRPFAFPGDADTRCRLLDGPVTALNVMTRCAPAGPARVAAGFAAGVEIVRAPLTLPERAGRTLLLVVLDGRARLGSTVLDRHDALLTGGTGDTGPASLECDEGTGVAVLVTLDDITGP